MEQPQSLEDLFLTGLQYAYDAEKKLTEALPKMAQGSTTPQLREAFEQHLKVTQQHVQRAEQVFQAMGKQPETKQSELCRASNAAGSESDDADDASLTVA